MDTTINNQADMLNLVDAFRWKLLEDICQLMKYELESVSSLEAVSSEDTCCISVTFPRAIIEFRDADGALIHMESSMLQQLVDLYQSTFGDAPELFDGDSMNLDYFDGGDVARRLQENLRELEPDRFEIQVIANGNYLYPQPYTPV